ncbi:hypothetical protein [Streptomyces acidicola]|uniref:Uncharacterized protein n=1 Tax=Streptomyces acidicola TaxID=2596892 RepID=A0A5N8WIC3_9ACTN|nr:hypothetical protein [Streptomyces acidicola]MPY47064.1 hypothetical protein [Streptomyces acidicola]MPY47203.1 hypothetical protein [Streptomyces acidicola]
MTDRAEYIAGLREIADWLEQHPDADLPSTDRLLLPLSTNPAVEEFAATLGLTAEIDEEGNAAVDLKFGPIAFHAYGYADFTEHVKEHHERQARNWADKNGMVIQPREGEPDEAREHRVVAYRNSSQPGVLLCREHGDGWAWLTPLTADDLPDGGTCTFGDPADPDDVCGNDVLINDTKSGGAR